MIRAFLIAAIVQLVIASNAAGQSQSKPLIFNIKKWKLVDYGEGKRVGQLFAENDNSLNLQIMCPFYEYTFLVRLGTIRTRFVGAPTGVSMGTRFMLGDRTVIRTKIGNYDRTEIWYMDSRTRQVAQHRHPHFFIKLLNRPNSKELLLYVTQETGKVVRRFDIAGFEAVMNFVGGTSRCRR